MKQLLGDRKHGNPPYWQLVLRYCAEGGLQAVHDEYAHMLGDSLQLAGKEPIAFRESIAESMCQALTLHTVNPGADQIELNLQSKTRHDLRAHFALRFGDKKDESNQVTTHHDQVRGAFNSPFYPFVLATTSIGQEGLDFHYYCHAVVHWNLPLSDVLGNKVFLKVAQFLGLLAVAITLTNA